MKYYYCSSCKKRIELKYKKGPLKSELQKNKEKTVINKYTIMNPKLCEINNILKNHVIDYYRPFVFYKIVFKGKLLFDNDISIDVKSMVKYRVSVLSHNLEKYLKHKIIYYKRQGTELSHISEKNITFITSLDHMTYKQYLAQPMPMVEGLNNKNLYKKYNLVKTLDDIDLTLHMGPYETGKFYIYSIKQTSNKNL